MAAEKNYGTLVKGGEYQWTVVLTGTVAWPAAVAATWTWKMLLGKRETKTTASANIIATSATRSTTSVVNDTLTIIFDLTSVASDLITAGVYYIELEGTEVAGTEHYYEDAKGELEVRPPRGGG